MTDDGEYSVVRRQHCDYRFLSLSFSYPGPGRVKCLRYQPPTFSIHGRAKYSSSSALIQSYHWRFRRLFMKAVVVFLKWSRTVHASGWHPVNATYYKMISNRSQPSRISSSHEWYHASHSHISPDRLCFSIMPREAVSQVYLCRAF